MDERRMGGHRVESGLCAEARVQVEATVAEAAQLKAVAQTAATSLRDVHRELAVARMSLEDAQSAADPRMVADAKKAARLAYKRQMDLSRTGGDRQRAVGDWLNEIDRVNRSARDAMARLVRMQVHAVALQQSVENAQRTADAHRIRAEGATRASIEARQRLAACEEQEAAAGGATPTGFHLARVVPIDTSRRATDPGTPAPGEYQPLTGMPGEEPDWEPIAVDEAAAPDWPEPARLPSSVSAVTQRHGVPDELVVERLMAGDRSTLRTLAYDLSEQTGHAPSHYLLLLQELIDAIVLSAAEDQMLTFDTRHPFWSQFTNGDARALVKALRDLGFQYDPRDGWYGGRVPGTRELALGLAYVGYDIRAMRGLPSNQAEIRELPRGIAVAPLEHLRRQAPELTVDQMIDLLGPRADRLGPLWDDWGRLRPTLLSEVDTRVDVETEVLSQTPVSV